ncbi:TRAP transporter large permease subunit [Candidatus Spongiihabitans sp.]|uniref:TRAP transporter large permease subunit n=1 Tax=Candidatus Spongiihabitans sp. TaxID=3101308 RepID=UPI003C6FC0D2
MELVFLAVLILLMIISLSSGFPVAFALPGSAIGAIGLAAICGYLFAGDASAYFAQDGPVQWLTAGVTNFRSLYWEVERDTLIAIPLFVFMGIMLQRSKVAEDLLVAMAQLFGPVPGGLGISVVFVGALLAATTGILGATVIAMGLISLPAMLRNNYSKPLASGIICASGTLGQIIPPSIVLIILADQLANAAEQARTLRAADYKEATGEFTMPAALDITSASAGDMFMGALVPGLILVGLYMLYILITAILKPGTAPPVPYTGKYDRQFASKIGIALIPPLTLIFAVLGSIVTGIATVNQAGAIGAVGAIVMGGYRLFEPNKHRYTPLLIAIGSGLIILVLYKSFDLNIKNISSQRDFIGVILAAAAVLMLIGAIVWSGWRTFKINDTLVGVMIDTAKTTSMVFIILIGAAMLTAAFRGFGGEQLVREFLTGLPGGFWTQFTVVMIVIFLLGFFLDFIEIAVVVVPIVAPILLADPAANITAVWLGVMIGLNIQTSFLTPPFGFALFYLRGVAPLKVKTTHIYKGAAAFIGLQLVGLTITGFFPGLVNYMPNRTFLTAETAPPPVNPKLQFCIENRVFSEYANDETNIRNSIAKARDNDFSVLPDEYRQPLIASFDLAENTFDLVAQVNVVAAELAAYSLEFKPLHADMRKLRNQLKSINNILEEARKKHDRISRNPATTRPQLDSLEVNIFKLEQELKAAEQIIPSHWDEASTAYQQLAIAEKSARLAYRRNVDAAYQALQNTLLVIGQRNDLARFETPLLDLRLHIESAASIDKNPESAIEKIKSVESRLNELAGVAEIKSKLSKSRRALKGDSPDFTPDFNDAKEFHRQAIDLLNLELAWRSRATALLDELNQYDNAIKTNIGLRLQPRLTKSQAKDIAACQSSHRDISLNF